MNEVPRPLARAAQNPIGFREFVALMAGLMAMNAMSIDPMLPALPAIGEALHIANPNHRQWIISVFFLGSGVGALFYGSLSDRYGRRPVIRTCLTLALITTLLCAIAKSFALLLIARFAGGFFSAAMRVVATSIVRDRYSGDRMAAVMSLAFMIFIIVPVVAPGIGQLVLLFASWRWIFGILFILIGSLLIWVTFRLPETLRPENRVAINIADLTHTLKRVVTHRQAFSYMLAAGVLMSTLLAFITSIQQIIFDIFDAQAIFPFLFAGIACFMAIGSFLNQRLVGRFGARRLSQGSLIAFTLLSATHVLVVLAGGESLYVFCLIMGLTFLSFAFVTSNFNAISMEPFAKGAGMAASFQAFLTTIISALLGSVVGYFYNGTTLPLSIGMTCFGIAGFAIMAYGERGRLFTRPHHQAMRDPAPPPPA